jgi:hypothetical protein
MAPAIELDFHGIATTALSAAATLLGEWLPDGHKRGKEWVSKNPTRHDQSEGSFSVNMATGSWADFATDDRGGDLISLYAYLNGLPQSQAARDIAERLHISAAVPRPAAKRRKASDEGWKPIVPVPSDAPEPSMNHRDHGAPSAYWTYRDADGRTLAHVVRIDQGDGGKIVLPLTYCRHGGTGRTAWRWKGLPAPRPLYNLDGLAARPSAPVAVVEGEKAADAAAQLLPDHVAVTSLNGSANARYADWAPLMGRHLVIWPDNDDAGRNYADTVAELLSGKAGSVKIITPPKNLPNHWDAADALACGWSRMQACDLVAQTTTREPTANLRNDRKGSSSASRRKEKSPSRPTSVTLTAIFQRRGAELWRRVGGEEWCSLPINDHFENYPVQSQAVEKWLTRSCLHETGQVPIKVVLEETIRTLQALAFDCPIYRIWQRVGWFEGAVYVDLGDDAHRAIEVTAHSGWRIIERPSVKFERDAAMKALPDPEPGGSIEQLRRFLNVSSDRDFYLLVGWLIAAFRPEPPSPIMVLTGEHGSAKTTATELLIDLVDPRIAGTRALPTNVRDLFIAAKSSRVLAFDNVSSIRAEVSDALCMIATGGGYSTRKLHTDSSLTVIEASPSVVLNGIVDFVTRSDLADRCIPVSLAPILACDRRPLSEIKADWGREAPEILGAVMDAISSALRHWNQTKLDAYERMADTQRWVTSAEPGLGWELGTFNKAYTEALNETRRDSIERSPVAEAIIQYHAKHGDFEGRASELLRILTGFVDEAVADRRYWPDTAQKMGNALKRCTGDLRMQGIDLTYRHSGNRTWSISKYARTP